MPESGKYIKDVCQKKNIINNDNAHLLKFQIFFLQN